MGTWVHIALLPRRVRSVLVVVMSCYHVEGKCAICSGIFFGYLDLDPFRALFFVGSVYDALYIYRTRKPQERCLAFAGVCGSASHGVFAQLFFYGIHISLAEVK